MIQSVVMAAILEKYMTDGPVYMRTRDTSSEMRFIRSPVKLAL